jgi:hypothetical protein
LDRIEGVEGACWVWSIVQAACDLSDPRQLPRFEPRLSSEVSGMLSRYVAMSERLLATTVMNADASVTVDLVTGGVTKSTPADDVTVGFAALLRQFFKPGEEASFDRVRKALSRVAHEAGADDVEAVLTQWKRAHQTLLSHHLRALMYSLAVDAGLEESPSDGGRRVSAIDELPPRELIEVFLYGDMLHWGAGREQLREWSKTERGAAEMEFHMRNDAHVLAHFYAGFAAIARVSLPS